MLLGRSSDEVDHENSSSNQQHEEDNSASENVDSSSSESPQSDLQVKDPVGLKAMGRLSPIGNQINFASTVNPGRKKLKSNPSNEAEFCIMPKGKVILCSFTRDISKLLLVYLNRWVLSLE